MGTQNIWWAIANSLRENKNVLLRLLIIYVAIYFVSFLLGFGVLLIVLGLNFMMRRLFIYWPPARNWLIKVIGMKLPENSTKPVQSSWTWLLIFYRSIIVLFYLAFGGLMLWLGIDVLVKQGFLGQNFIYLLFFK